METRTLTFEVLGPLRVRERGVSLKITPKSRIILAALLLEPARVVSVERLVQLIWDERPPERAIAALHVHVSTLRAALDGATPAVVTQQPGYLIDVTAENLDLLAFERAVADARSLRANGQVGAALDAYGRALALWRGNALCDIDGTTPVVAMRAWLDDRRIGVIEEYAELQLTKRAYLEVVDELEPLVNLYPLRERLWESLIRALYLSGRQADALAAYRRAQAVLSDQLGIDPRAQLRDLETAILQQSLRSVSVPTPAVDLPATLRVPSATRARIRLSDGSEQQIRDVVTIGRNPGCTIVLADESVSRRHAEIRPLADGYLIRDLGSSNGIRIAGMLTTQQLLRSGDLIQLGECSVTFVAD